MIYVKKLEKSKTVTVLYHAELLCRYEAELEQSLLAFFRRNKKV